MILPFIGVIAFIALLATAVIGGFRMGADPSRKLLPRLVVWCLVPFVPLTIGFVALTWFEWRGEATLGEILSFLPVFWVLLAGAWIPPSLFAAFYSRYRNRRSMNVIDVLDVL